MSCLRRSTRSNAGENDIRELYNLSQKLNKASASLALADEHQDESTISYAITDKSDRVVNTIHELKGRRL